MEQSSSNQVNPSTASASKKRSSRNGTENYIQSLFLFAIHPPGGVLNSEKTKYFYGDDSGNPFFCTDNDGDLDTGKQHANIGFIGEPVSGDKGSIVFCGGKCLRVLQVKWPGAQPDTWQLCIGEKKCRICEEYMTQKKTGSTTKAYSKSVPLKFRYRELILSKDKSITPVLESKEVNKENEEGDDVDDNISDQEFDLLEDDLFMEDLFEDQVRLLVREPFQNEKERKLFCASVSKRWHKIFCPDGENKVIDNFIKWADQQSKGLYDRDKTRFVHIAPSKESFEYWNLYASSKRTQLFRGNNHHHHGKKFYVTCTADDIIPIPISSSIEYMELINYIISLSSNTTMRTRLSSRYQLELKEKSDWINDIRYNGAEMVIVTSKENIFLNLKNAISSKFILVLLFEVDDEVLNEITLKAQNARVYVINPNLNRKCTVPEIINGIVHSIPERFLFQRFLTNGNVGPGFVQFDPENKTFHHANNGMQEMADLLSHRRL